MTNRIVKGTLPSEPLSADEYKVLCTMVNFHFDALLSALGGGLKIYYFHLSFNFLWLELKLLIRLNSCGGIRSLSR